MQLEVAIMLLCNLMNNDLVWNQHGLDANEVVQSAFAVLNQWTSAQDKTFDQFMGYMIQEDGHEHWQQPTMNKVKINIDAAIFEESNC